MVLSNLRQVNFFRLSSFCAPIIKAYRFNNCGSANYRTLHLTAQKMNKANHKKTGISAVPKTQSNKSKSGVSLGNSTEEVEVLQSPVKSFSDKKEYRVIRLKNGLTACLISDTSESSDSESDTETETESDSSGSWETETETSGSENDTPRKYKKTKDTDEVKLAAAALCVGVGSFSDPVEVPGLAHFLEHMVFMGSEKFPEENDFDSYITKHGGSDNGSTDYEVTTFYFECFEKYFVNALDKFAQFFISPLMKRDSLSRERESVESEFQMAVPADDNRIEQLLMSLANKSSPINSFSWGNLVSLRDNIDEEELYEKLHQFRKRHYSAHRMTVAVQARRSLDVLQSYVVNCFSKVPNNNLPPSDFSCYNENVFNTPEFPRIYYVKPMRDTCQVILTWVMPPLMHKYKSKPYDYVGWLLGHEGQGGLLSYLKRQVWAFSLEAGTGTSGADFNSLYTAFSVSILLTKDGCKNLHKVIEAVFSYIKLLKHVGPSERIFKEIQTIQDVSFRFDEEENPSDIVEALVENMQIYPPENYLTGSELYFKYEPEEITKVMNYLTPTKMNVMVLTTTTPDGIVYNKVEPWFNIHYCDQEIPHKTLEKWNAIEPFPYFMLPEPNQFLTEDFSLLPKVKNNPAYPIKIMDNNLVELWYRKDQTFELPMAYFYYYLSCPFSLESVENMCMLQIFVLILNMNIMEDGYPAKLADLTYSVTAWERGILIKVVGFNEKLPKLIHLIAKYLNNCANSFDETLFETVKSKFKQNTYNVLLRPSKLCNDIRSSILQTNYVLLIDKYTAISKISYSMMKDFSQKVLDHLYLQALIQGNLTQAVALESTNILMDELKFKPIASLEQIKVQVNEIPVGEFCCRVPSLNKENKNSTITNYYQYGPLTIKDNVILEFILLLLEEPLFDTLRTKEQLGYSIFSTIRDTYGILGYSITVHTQADKYTTKYIDDRIEAFVTASKTILKKMNVKKFNQTKTALVQLKQVIDVDLEDEVERNWEEIVFGKYKFDRLKQEINAIQKLKSAEILKWWENINICNKDNCRKLTVQVVGHVTNPKIDGPHQNIAETTKFIQDDNINVSDDKFHQTDSLTTKEGIILCFIQDENELKERNLPAEYYITDIRNFKQNLKVLT